MNYKILIVDDSIENLQMLFSIFRKHLPDYEVFQTNNPENVIGIASKAKPDIIITDWDMPQISGIELVKALKKNNETKNIPVIMVTGVMLTADNLKIALDAGAIDYLRKPVNPIELIARINSAMLLTSYYNQIMKQKDAELTESALHLVKSNEFMNSFINKIKDIKHIVKTNPEIAIESLTELGQQILQKNSEDSWFRFELTFSKMHKDFSKNIHAVCPKITPAEVKLCSFIRLGMSNKEISAVLNQTSNSVKVSRYRIRKKLDMDRSSNFETFLAQF